MRWVMLLVVLMLLMPEVHAPSQPEHIEYSSYLQYDIYNGGSRTIVLVGGGDYPYHEAILILPVFFHSDYVNFIQTAVANGYSVVLPGGVATLSEWVHFLDFILAKYPESTLVGHSMGATLTLFYLEARKSNFYDAYMFNVPLIMANASSYEIACVYKNLGKVSRRVDIILSSQDPVMTWGDLRNRCGSGLNFDSYDAARYVQNTFPNMQITMLTVKGYAHSPFDPDIAWRIITLLTPANLNLLNGAWTRIAVYRREEAS